MLMFFGKSKRIFFFNNACCWLSTKLEHSLAVPRLKNSIFAPISKIGSMTFRPLETPPLNYRLSKVDEIHILVTGYDNVK